jgi:hypothetical protein
MARTGEVTITDPAHLEFRGSRFELRHTSRVRIYEQVD